MIDSNGFRSNVGIILVSAENRLFFARRVGGQDAWQFPQGGIQKDETVQEALYRELYEEIGLNIGDVEILACSKYWFSYRLPPKYIRHTARPICRGQKQKWFMLRLLSDERSIRLNCSDSPEFDEWCWVNYWDPLKRIIDFKKAVYYNALTEFESFLR